MIVSDLNQYFWLTVLRGSRLCLSYTEDIKLRAQKKKEERFWEKKVWVSLENRIQNNVCVTLILYENQTVCSRKLSNLVCNLMQS